MKKNLTAIKNWDESQRPREKFLAKGAGALGTEELIAIILGSGTTKKNAVELSRELLDAADNDLHRLSKFSLEEYEAFEGMGEAKAVSIMALFEFSKRYQTENAQPLPRIYSSLAAADNISPLLKDLPYEECWVMYLNRNNRLIAREKITSGGTYSTVLDVKMILKKAMAKLATSIILIHNHPSGSLKPGKDDIIQTRRLVNAAKLCDIAILDHLIITPNGYFSFSDDGAI